MRRTALQNVRRFPVPRGELFAVALFLLVGVSSARGQSSERSLRTWVDTLDLNLCEDHEFETWGVWVESASETDTVIGFQLSDSVLAIDLTLRWDTSRVRLLPPYVLAPVQSLVGRLASKVQAVDTNSGELYISASADLSLKPAVGTGIPLFYLRGRLRETDTTFGIPEGGARVQQITLEGSLGSRLSTIRHLPGYIQVVRDTTPEYTGTLQASDLDLDTGSSGVVEVVAGNLAGKNVQNLHFSLVMDSGEVTFVEVLPMETGHPWFDIQRAVNLGTQRIDVEYSSNGGGALPPLADYPVIRFRIERTTDSQFVTDIRLSDLDYNATACLGRLVAEWGSVTGARIVPVDTTGDTSRVSVSYDHDAGQTSPVWIDADGNVRIDATVRKARFYDAMGRELEIRTPSHAPAGFLKVENGYSGPVFAVIQLNDGRILRVKQYIKSE